MNLVIYDDDQLDEVRTQVYTAFLDLEHWEMFDHCVQVSHNKTMKPCFSAHAVAQRGLVRRFTHIHVVDAAFSMPSPGPSRGGFSGGEPSHVSEALPIDGFSVCTRETVVFVTRHAQTV